MIMNRNTTIGIFLIVVGISLMTMVSRFRSEDDAGDFTRQELEILDGADSFMRVLTRTTWPYFVPRAVISLPRRFYPRSSPDWPS